MVRKSATFQGDFVSPVMLEVTNSAIIKYSSIKIILLGHLCCCYTISFLTPVRSVRQSSNFHDRPSETNTLFDMMHGQMMELQQGLGTLPGEELARL